MELVSLLTTANEAGFSVGAMIGLAIIYQRLSSKNDKHWNKLIATLENHNEVNEKRFTTIETHIGLKK